MRFGINSLLFTDTFNTGDLPLLEHAHGLGFEVIEISPVDPATFPARAVREQADALGMTVNINFALPEAANPISPDPMIRANAVETSKRIIDICAEVDAAIYCGANYAAWRYFSGKRRTDAEWQWGVEVMQEVAGYAASQCDVVIGVEILNRFESYFLNTAADGVRFIDDVGMPNVKIHLDTFHMIREEDDMAGAILTCGDRLGYFHACGSHRGIPGKDVVPWLETFAALKQSGYTGPITIESFHPDKAVAPLVAVWRDFADSPEQLATAGLAFLKDIYQETFGSTNLEGRV